MTDIKLLEKITAAAKSYATPFYLYDEETLIEHCRQVLNMPNAFGLTVKYAMKANSGRALLQIISANGLNIDASSLNEVRRAHLAGIPYSKIMLTTQEVPVGTDKIELEAMIKDGLNYNVCSLRQLELISDFASANKIPLSVRIHPGVGSGESASRNTGDKYSCFGIHKTDWKKVIDNTSSKGIKIIRIHVHIGSGGDPEKWQENIDRELAFIKEYFPDTEIVNFGGGLKVARMPDEIPADIQELGEYAKKRIEEFYKETGRKLKMEIEPGTFVVANAGYLVLSVIDKKQTGPDGFEFVITNGGMETNARPLLYGSRHPFYIISKEGKLLSNETDLDSLDDYKDLRIIVGRCCESGDSQSLDENGRIVPRKMADPDIDDYIVVGGCGAYCSAMTPFNYNSHYQISEILLRTTKELVEIRKCQTLEHMLENEVSLED